MRWRELPLTIKHTRKHANTHNFDLGLAWALYSDPNKLRRGRACLSLSQVNDVINDYVAEWMGAAALPLKHLSS